MPQPKRRRLEGQTHVVNTFTTSNTIQDVSNMTVTQSEQMSTQLPSTAQSSTEQPSTQPSQRQKMMDNLREGKKYVVSFRVSIFDYSSKKKATKRLADVKLNVDSIEELKV
jgi:hypothetical protein